MYGPDLARMDHRLSYLAELADSAAKIAGAGKTGGSGDEVAALPDLLRFARERLVHVAAECVTDIGNDLIDWFIMQDPSSYEDIVDILHGEGIFADDLYAFLRELALMRKPLVQQYDETDGDKVADLANRLPDMLPAFAKAARGFLDQEMARYRLQT